MVDMLMLVIDVLRQDFFATWCGPCKQIGPYVPTLAGEFPNCVFVKVDVDEADDLSEVRHAHLICITN